VLALDANPQLVARRRRTVKVFFVRSSNSKSCSAVINLTIAARRSRPYRRASGAHVPGRSGKSLMFIRALDRVFAEDRGDGFDVQ
jgi:hypothetical protein